MVSSDPIRGAGYLRPVPVFNHTVLEHVVQIADPFHVIRAANQRLDECRRRVQNQTLGHRGHKGDPLYGIRRLLTMATERLDHTTAARLKARPAHGEVEWAYQAKEIVRDIYRIDDQADAVTIVDDLPELMVDKAFPPEVNQLARMLDRWLTQVTNWHCRRVSNGPTEGANKVIKLAKRIGSGFRSFRNDRVRALLYAGRPYWGLCAEPLF